MIESARPQLELSRTMEKTTDNFRTSTNTFLYASQNPTAMTISHRIAEITRLDVYLQEPLQVVRYEPGQHYNAHYDAFQVGKLLTRNINYEFPVFNYFQLKNKICHIIDHTNLVVTDLLLSSFI